MSQKFTLRLILEQDAIEIEVTNESVDYKKLNPDAVLRPRHINLTDELLRVIKEKGK